jgi:3',5'-cyclic AMP phosphodiesterase CpdA
VIRLLHLSDLHLAPVPWPLMVPPRLKPVLGYLNHIRHRPPEHDMAALARTLAQARAIGAHHTIVTGDLVEIGHSAEYARAAELLATLAPPPHLAVAPGNHDLYTCDAPARLLACWRPFLPAAAQAPPADLRDLFPRLDRLGPVNLITLCSGLPTWTFSAEGAIGAAQLMRLDRMLAAQPASIVALHHPPHAPGLSRLKRLRDADALVDLLIARGVGLVLHGHLHVASDQMITRASGRALRCVGAPSASAATGAGFVAVVVAGNEAPQVEFHTVTA